jgi:site-specific DNA recombinase
MSTRGPKAPFPAGPKVIRCAIYTRKSTEEGLAQEFNSLDAQRDSAEAFIASQRNEGWTALPDRYDDGGFSGGTIERPALRRLLADIEAGKVDCVVVYKVDRLSRSLLDFARIMQVFESKGASFVSVTQQFNTTHSMGRLTLNVLLSFAQFEREIIGERIRDKIAAQRRKGKWTGGVAVLGYDVDRTTPTPKLVVNAAEAARVREIFALYLKEGALLAVVRELDRRGWRTKALVTAAGKARGGLTFDKGTLYGLLTNPLYAGKIRHKDQLFDGEHSALIEPELFGKVQTLLQHNGRSGGVEVRNRHGALLKRLLHCRACGHAMTHTFTAKRGRQYRYYTCVRAIKSGRAACPSASLPAAEIERVVVEQIRCIGRDPALLADVLAAARAGIEAEVSALRAERGDLMRELARHHAELHKLAANPMAGNAATGRLADLHERIQRDERRGTEIEAKLATLERERVSDADVRAAFADFQNVWGQLGPREQSRLLALLVARVEYDAAARTVSVSFHASGIKALSEPSMEQAA